MLFLLLSILHSRNAWTTLDDFPTLPKNPFRRHEPWNLASTKKFLFSSFCTFKHHNQRGVQHIAVPRGEGDPYGVLFLVIHLIQNINTQRTSYPGRRNKHRIIPFCFPSGQPLTGGRPHCACRKTSTKEMFPRLFSLAVPTGSKHLFRFSLFNIFSLVAFLSPKTLISTPFFLKTEHKTSMVVCTC